MIHGSPVEWLMSIAALSIIYTPHCKGNKCKWQFSAGYVNFGSVAIESLCHGMWFTANWQVCIPDNASCTSLMASSNCEIFTNIVEIYNPGLSAVLFFQIKKYLASSQRKVWPLLEASWDWPSSRGQNGKKRRVRRRRKQWRNRGRKQRREK